MLSKVCCWRLNVIAINVNGHGRRHDQSVTAISGRITEGISVENICEVLRNWKHKSHDDGELEREVEDTMEDG